MKKAFIATPMSAFSKEEYAELSKTIKEIQLESDYEIFAEITTVTLDTFLPPSEALDNDLAAIRQSDVFIAIYPKQVLTSLFLELGYAMANKKEIFIFVKDKKALPFLLLDHPGVIEYKDNKQLNEFIMGVLSV